MIISVISNSLLKNMYHKEYVLHMHLGIICGLVDKVVLLSRIYFIMKNFWISIEMLLWNGYLFSVMFGDINQLKIEQFINKYL